MITAKLVALVAFLILGLSAECEANIPFGLLGQSGGVPNHQRLPCTLSNQATDDSNNTDYNVWGCELSMGDAARAGATPGTNYYWAPIVGFSVLSAKYRPGHDFVTEKHIFFGVGARLFNGTIDISHLSPNDLHIQELVPTTPSGGRRNLANKSGILTALVVRVTTTDASLRWSKQEMSDNVFGTHGDQVNLKDTLEECSHDEVTLNPAPATTPVCVSDPNFHAAYRWQASGDLLDCGSFYSSREYFCGIAGNWADINGSGLTANQACCACGAGTYHSVTSPVTDGVIDISLPIPAAGNDRSRLEEATLTQLAHVYRTDSVKSVYDLVMLCLPHGSAGRGGSPNWVAYGYVGGVVTVYNGDRNSASPHTHIHEIGHNFGLDHSSERGDQFNVEYGDQTSVMGYGIGVQEEIANGNKFCFNGAQSWELGWYANYNLEIDPLTETYIGGLAGVDRVRNLANDEKFVVKLLQASGTEDYYLVFNHAFGPNVGTIEAPNEVTITTRDRERVARTWLVAHLRETEHYTIPNYNGSGQDVTIHVSTIDSSARGRANVAVYQGSIQNLPASNPVPGTPLPTISPGTPLPTISPGTPLPTISPGTPLPTISPGTPLPTISPGTPLPTISPGTPLPTISPGTPLPTISPGTPLVPTTGPTTYPTTLPTTFPTGGGPTSIPSHHYVPTTGPTTLPTTFPTGGGPTSIPSHHYVPTTGPTTLPTTIPTGSGPTSVPSANRRIRKQFVGISVNLNGIGNCGAKCQQTLVTALTRLVKGILQRMGYTNVGVRIIIRRIVRSGSRRLQGGGAVETVEFGVDCDYDDGNNVHNLTEVDVGTNLLSDPNNKNSFINDLKESDPSEFETLEEVTSGWNGQQVESNGDPHFKTWKNEHFEYHGQCDLVLVSNPNFANGLGVDIHIRTKIVRFWSYIQSAVIRIGNDILEVEGSPENFKVSYWMNYEHKGELEHLGGFPVSINDNMNLYTIDLGSMYPGEKIQFKTFKEFVGVKIIGASESSFGGSTGITGDFASGKTYARDGSTVLNDYTALGQEWQVLPSDGIFFHQVSQPQFPEKCWVPEDPRGERARRLDEQSVTQEEAEIACSQLEDEFSRKGCIYDIIATQDLGMVGAY